MDVVAIGNKCFEKTSQASSRRLLTDAKPYRLQHWEDVGGTVTAVEGFQGACIATISSSKSVLLPKAFTALLRKAINQRVMILRTDEGFRMRIIQSTNPDIESLIIIREDGSIEMIEDLADLVRRKPEAVSSWQCAGGDENGID